MGLEGWSLRENNKHLEIVTVKEDGGLSLPEQAVGAT
jgi:hypothetical protein